MKLTRLFLILLLFGLVTEVVAQYSYPTEDWETAPYYWQILYDGIEPATSVPGYPGSHGWYIPVSNQFSYGDMIPDPTVGLWSGVQGLVNGVSPFSPVPETDPLYVYTDPTGVTQYTSP